MIVRVVVALEPGVRLTLVGLTATVRPVAVGETEAVSVTVPVNPELVTVQVEVVELPATTDAVLGEHVRLMDAPPTVSVTVVV